MRTLLLLALLAAPVSAQVYEVGPVSPGPVVFVVPEGLVLLATDRALTGRTTAVATASSRFYAVGRYELEIAFYDLERRYLGDSWNAQEGERAFVCGFVTFEGERVGVEVECSCVAPELPTLAPDLLTWSSDDPAIARLEDLRVCEA